MAKSKKQKQKESNLPLFIFLAVVFIVFGLIGPVVSSLQDKPYCYYEVRTGYENPATREDIIKKVFIECP